MDMRYHPINLCLICILIYSAALLAMAKMWKQPICPLMNE